MAGTWEINLVNHGGRGVGGLALKPRYGWRGSLGKAKVASRTREIQPSVMERGAYGKVGYGSQTEAQWEISGRSHRTRRLRAKITGNLRFGKYCAFLIAYRRPQHMDVLVHLATVPLSANTPIPHFKVATSKGG